MKIALVIENNGAFVPNVEEALESAWDDYDKAERHILETYEVKPVIYQQHGDEQDRFKAWVEAEARAGERYPHQFYIVECLLQS